MAKYDHIDNAQDEFNNLAVQLKQLQKELKDVDILDNSIAIGIDSTTRVFDFWFDNIFTDLNVREKICSDIEELSSLLNKIEAITAKLQRNKKAVLNELSAKEQAKEELLIRS